MARKSLPLACPQAFIFVDLIRLAWSKSLQYRRVTRVHHTNRNVNCVPHSKLACALMGPMTSGQVRLIAIIGLISVLTRWKVLRFGVAALHDVPDSSHRIRVELPTRLLA